MWFCTTLLFFHPNSYTYVRKCKELTKCYHRSLLNVPFAFILYQNKTSGSRELKTNKLRGPGLILEKASGPPAARGNFSSRNFALLRGHCWAVLSRFALSMLPKQKWMAKVHRFFPYFPDIGPEVTNKGHFSAVFALPPHNHTPLLHSLFREFQDFNIWSWNSGEILALLKFWLFSCLFGFLFCFSLGFCFGFLVLFFLTWHFSCTHCFGNYKNLGVEKIQH